MTGSSYVAGPAGGGPGVLVLHAWWGLSDGIRRFCDLLAGEGFVALAPDLCDGRTAATIPEAQALVDELDEEAAIRRAGDGLAGLRAHPVADPRTARRGGASPWASGSRSTWRRSTTTWRPSSYYGTASDIDHTRHRAPVLGHFAENDQFEPAEEVSALEDGLRRANRAVRFHVYPGAGHWFAA